MRIGYYDLEAGEGVDAQAQTLLGSHHRGDRLGDVSTASTAGRPVVWAQNGASSYAVEFLANSADLLAYVEGGGVALLNDAAVTGAVISAFIPSIDAGFIHADSTGADSEDVNFVCDQAFLTYGAGGFLDDASLDGITSASYGYIDIDGVCDGQVGFLMTRGDARQGVTILARSGDGFSIYSTVGAMDHLTGSGAADLAMQAFAENLIGEGARLAKFDPITAQATMIGTNGSELMVADDSSIIVGNLQAGRDMFYGSTFGDGVSGGDGADMLWGLGGNDALMGRDGRDQLWGGEGDDTIQGGNGKDFLVGGSGGDSLRGAAGDDTMFGNSGEDNIYGRRGVDILFGGEDNDRFFFAPGESGTADFADQAMDFEGSGADVIDLLQFGQMAYRPGGAFTGGPFDEFMIQVIDANTSIVRLDFNSDSASDYDIIVHHDGFFDIGDVAWNPPL